MFTNYSYQTEIPKKLEIPNDSVHFILKDILNGKYRTVAEVSNKYNVHQFVIKELVINHVHATLYLTNKLTFPLIAIYRKIREIPIEGIVHKVYDLTPTDLKRMMNTEDVNQLPEDLKKLRATFEDLAIRIRMNKK